MVPQLSCDVLIIGSGAAGLSTALRLPENLNIVVVAKRELAEGNTVYAQGGISAVLDSADSLESHVADTLSAGAGLGNEAVIRRVVERGPENIRWLAELGVHFTSTPPTGDSKLHLTQEGGHSHRRVAHVADATGREMQTTLVDVVRTRKNIQLLENHIAVDLILRPSKAGGKRCVGSYLMNLESNQVMGVGSRCVVLATGGASKAYLYTSNPDVATGDGIAMAWRSGCRRLCLVLDFQLQHVVEAVEGAAQGDPPGQLHDLRLGEMFTQAVEHRVAHPVEIVRDLDRIFHDEFVDRVELRMVLIVQNRLGPGRADTLDGEKRRVMRDTIVTSV